MSQTFFREERNLPTRTIQVSDEQKEAILNDILERNAIRRLAGLPTYDVEAQAKTEVADLADAMYEDALRPYVVRFYKEIVGIPGVPGRVAQHIEVYQAAEAALRDAEGIVRPRPLVFDLMKFLTKYQAGELTDWGGAFSPA